MTDKDFPRKLNEDERRILFSLLPENRSGYSQYRKLIDVFFVIGEGRFGNGNLILGDINSKPDLSIPSSPVLALGYIHSEADIYYVVIHSLDDNKIEVQIDPFPVKKEIQVDKIVSYSEWKPGMKSPEKSASVYEYSIVEDKYLLAICPLSKKIWLYESESGINYLIPLSNFFNELMRLKNIKDEKSITNPSGFFKEIDKYSKSDIKLAFLLYNKYLKKFDFGDELARLISETEDRKRSFKFFGRGLN